ncbi:unnamed protein product [Calypogeia fissa]
MSGRIILTSLVLVVLFFKPARMVLIEAYRAAAFLSYGSLNFTRSAFLKHAKKFNEGETQTDMTGKNCIITGANQGIGYATAEALASRGANVYLVCRSQAKGEKALSDIKAKTDNQNVSLEVCDLSSMQQIKDLASKYASTDQPLHVLVNNAGLMENERVTTAEGLEMNFAVNVAGVYALTELLIPALEKAAPEARVITVSSGGMYTQPLSTYLQYEDQKKMDGTSQYARNKRVQVAMAEHWTEVYGPKGIGFYTMHPGWADTAALAQSMPGFRDRTKGLLRTVDQGADTIVWLAQQSNSQLQPAGFYFDRVNSSKHLAGFQTSYSPDQVIPLVSAIRALCGLPSN